MASHSRRMQLRERDAGVANDRTHHRRSHRTRQFVGRGLCPPYSRQSGMGAVESGDRDETLAGGQRDLHPVDMGGRLQPALLRTQHRGDRHRRQRNRPRTHRLGGDRPDDTTKLRHFIARLYTQQPLREGVPHCQAHTHTQCRRGKDFGIHFPIFRHRLQPARQQPALHPPAARPMDSRFPQRARCEAV